MSAPIGDTTDLRSGAPLHDALLALLPLVGVWGGEGVGVVASGERAGEQFRFGQQVVVGHDGRPFLAYSSRSWLLDDDGEVIRAAWRETGFWRPGASADDVELVVASNTGQALVFAGTAGDRTWEIATLVADHTPTAVDVAGERRLYALRDTDSGEQLIYATELRVGDGFAPHLNGRLVRVPAEPDPDRS